MYLHLGQSIVVRLRDVVGIFDIETTSVGKATRTFLAAAEKGMLLTDVGSDLPKSFVVCNERGQTRVYLSQIASATLKRRCKYVNSLRQTAAQSAQRMQQRSEQL